MHSIASSIWCMQRAGARSSPPPAAKRIHTQCINPMSDAKTNFESVRNPCPRREMPWDAAQKKTLPLPQWICNDPYKLHCSCQNCTSRPLFPCLPLMDISRCIAGKSCLSAAVVELLATIAGVVFVQQKLTDPSRYRWGQRVPSLFGEYLSSALVSHVGQR